MLQPLLISFLLSEGSSICNILYLKRVYINLNVITSVTDSTACMHILAPTPSISQGYHDRNHHLRYWTHHIRCVSKAQKEFTSKFQVLLSADTKQWLDWDVIECLSTISNNQAISSTVCVCTQQYLEFWCKLFLSLTIHIWCDVFNILDVVLSWLSLRNRWCWCQNVHACRWVCNRGIHWGLM